MDSTDTIKERFCLTRPNFILDPKADAEFYAPISKVNIRRIVEGLQVTLITQRPPKRLFWGVYGGGKTHTLFHLTNQLKTVLKLDIIPVYVECPSVPKNSTFLHLYHDGIMSSMGQDFVVNIFKELVQGIGLLDFFKLIDKLKSDILEDEELSRAVAAQFLGSTPEKELIFWKYISGVTLSQKDLTDLKQTKSLSDAIPSRLANIIILIGKVLKKVQGKTLLLILDELDRLKTVTDIFGASTYEEALRKLVDENQKDVAIIMSFSAEALNKIPLIGREGGPILSRIGSNNIIEISQIEERDVDNFIKAILGEELGIVDKKLAKDRITELKGSTKETLDLDFFPFTKEAINSLKGTLRGVMTPREITQRMSDIVGRGFITNKNIITKDIVEVG